MWARSAAGSLAQPNQAQKCSVKNFLSTNGLLEIRGGSLTRKSRYQNQALVSQLAQKTSHIGFAGSVIHIEANANSSHDFRQVDGVFQ
jgi:hypothetical protein